jgi:TM2 domain-containing membrane protein YozV/endogenous inhibitor of DNA gyrase (YacG/DUF329 family)
MMVICPTCGREINNEKFCPNCGTAIPKQNESSNTKFCSNCGDKIDIKAEICPNCGVRQDLNNNDKTTKFCSNCGSEIDFKAEICPRCGVRQSGFSTSSDKNVWVAVLLSLLIVGLGHFYLGLPKKGAMLLILTIISWILIAVAIGVILYPLILIYGIYDVYQSAVALSEGRHVEDELFGGKFL